MATNNVINFQINVVGDANKVIGNITNSFGGAEKSANSFMNKIKNFANIGFVFNHITSALKTISGTVQGFENAYKIQAEAETKLAAVMRRTIGAGNDEIESIKRLASEQQKLGVIGDEVMLGGAQEIATYVEKTSSIEKLIPAMNDMVAQQYGLNASQEQYTQIATMVGKVMQGQTGALSRYGYGFTEAQEKVLKFGTEEERAATLADVIAESVGGVNKALAATPEGKLKQQANNMGDLHERIGSLVVQVKSALAPINDKIQEVIEKVISFFERNKDKILEFTTTIANGISSLFGTVYDVAVSVIGFIKPLAPLIIGVGLAIAAYTVYVNAAAYATAAWKAITKAAEAVSVTYTLITKAAAAGTSIWTAAQTGLSTVMMMNPIGLVIAAIVALIAVIAYVVYKTDGWGKQWESVVGFMKNGFYAFVEGVKWYFNTLVNGIMIGLDKIRLGWYKFKEAVGLGDSSETAAAIAKINADVEERQQAIVDGAKKVAEYGQKAKESLTWELSWNSDRSLGDIFTGLKKKLTGEAQEIGGMPGVLDPTPPSGEGGSGGLGIEKQLGKTGSSAAGDSKIKNINITIDKVIERFEVKTTNLKESAERIKDMVAQAVIEGINDVNLAF